MATSIYGPEVMSICPPALAWVIEPAAIRRGGITAGAADPPFVGDAEAPGAAAVPSPGNIDDSLASNPWFAARRRGRATPIAYCCLIAATASGLIVTEDATLLP